MEDNATLDRKAVDAITEHWTQKELCTWSSERSYERNLQKNNFN